MLLDTPPIPVNASFLISLRIKYLKNMEVSGVPVKICMM
jgi:hypothetical protein